MQCGEAVSMSVRGKMDSTGSNQQPSRGAKRKGEKERDISGCNNK